VSPTRAHALTALEVASGIVLGAGNGAGARLPAARSGETPLEALERACLPALERGPCLVSFSGGRDSSVVLAAAAHAARREGLPLPVPATNRFPGALHADETRWQELVVSHLGLTDWLRTDYTDELDAVGPVASRVLRRHGLLWPFNAHFHAPLLDAARGGSLLTGIGGDEIFGRSRWARATTVLTLRERPRARDAARIALLASPRRVRREVLRRRFPAAFPWLTPDALGDLTRGWGADSASEPARFDRRIEWLCGRRWLQVGTRSLELLAGDAEATVGHPLLSLEFGAALTAAAGTHGFDDRGAALRALFGELLPDQVLSRTTKACFDSAFWTRHSRAFAQGWDGQGVDPTVVDPAALRAVWSGPEPDAHTYLLLQAAWLTRRAGAKKGHLDVSGVAGGSRAA
jgi:asparagine synthetase B (glutamine-hydrolysing)